MAEAGNGKGSTAHAGGAGRHELSAKQREKLSFIWSVKETLRDHYKRHQYQDVILPFCVLRRLDCVLEPTKDKVVAKADKLGTDKWDAATDVLAHAAGQPFWNASKFTFSSLLADQHNIRRNVHAYVRGFSPNARDALVRFGLPNQIDKMAEPGSCTWWSSSSPRSTCTPRSSPTWRWATSTRSSSGSRLTCRTRKPESTSPHVK